MAEVSSLSHLRFLDTEEQEEQEVREMLTLDLLGPDRSDIHPADVFDRSNQVNFVMDLLQQRFEQSNFTGDNQFGSESVNESDFGVIEQNHEMGVNYLDLELGLGLGLGLGVEFDGMNGVCDDNCNAVVVSAFGDGFFPARIDSESEDDGNDLVGIDMNLEEDFAVDNVNDEDVSIPLCWDSLQLEDHREENEEFEWEEVDERVDETEVLSVVADSDEEETISVLPINGPEEEGVGERGRGLGNLEWEVLFNVRNSEIENELGTYFVDHDDNIDTIEYEMMFGQFADGENAILGRPPASKLVVENLTSMVISEEDVMNDNALCAVCKDQVDVGELAKQLPCLHHYHGDCILPWLGIRNTCPVCRYELPTDDADYELRRRQRAARLL